MWYHFNNKHLSINKPLYLTIALLSDPVGCWQVASPTESPENASVSLMPGDLCKSDAWECPMPGGASVSLMLLDFRPSVAKFQPTGWIWQPPDPHVNGSYCSTGNAYKDPDYSLYRSSTPAASAWQSWCKVCWGGRLWKQRPLGIIVGVFASVPGGMVRAGLTRDAFQGCCVSSLEATVFRQIKLLGDNLGLDLYLPWNPKNLQPTARPKPRTVHYRPKLQQ